MSCSGEKWAGQGCLMTEKNENMRDQAKGIIFRHFS